MPALHNRDRDASDYPRTDYRDDRNREDGNRDREISLGTGTILAIFFALAIICAAFFGFGYSMGRKSAQAPAIGSAAPPTPSSFSSFKPSASSPASQPSTAVKRDRETAASLPTDTDSTIVTTPVSSAEDASPAPRSTADPTQSAQEPVSAPIVREAPRAPTALSQSQLPGMPAINPNGTSIVQIAAVSHQEDADVLMAALNKRGYAVFIRQEPQDRLLHVQVGPFATRKDAEAMRQRLLSDGYNAIVK